MICFATFLQIYFPDNKFELRSVTLDNNRRSLNKASIISLIAWLQYEPVVGYAIQKGVHLTI